MQVTETQSDGLKKEFKVVVAAKDIAEKLDHRLQEIGQQVRVPGFRPGKVPPQILKQRFGPSVMGEILERAVNDSSNQAISERGLRPALRPKIEIVAFDEGKDLEYTMALELLPEIKIMDFAKLELEHLSVDVPDSEVESALERLAGMRKNTQPLAKARKSKSGDVLVIDFNGTVDGEALPGMAGEDHHLELGSNRFVAGFEEQLIRVSAGEEHKVTVTFPDEYVNDKLAGREAIFEVKVKEILEAVPMAIDDELATALGEKDLASLRDKVREQVGQDYSRLTRARLKRSLLDELADGHDFPVPPAMVEAEFDAIWGQIQEDREHGRLDPDDADKDEDTLKSEYQAIAVRRVRLGLLLSEVGRINGIDVTQDELNRALADEARRHPGQEREVFEYFKKNPEAQANLRAPIYEDKVVDFITALAKVKERKMSVEELTAEMEEAAGKSSKKPAKKAAAKKPAKKAVADAKDKEGKAAKKGTKKS